MTSKSRGPSPMPSISPWSPAAAPGIREHLHAALTTGKASAALAASIFHYGTYTIEETKRYLAERGVPVRLAAS